MDEKELLLRAARGDSDAFEKLFAPLEGMAYHHCLAMLKNPDDASDAAQEAMLRAYRALSGYRGGGGLGTWLYRIAHNVCLDVLKKRGGREAYSLEAMRESGFDLISEDAPPDAEHERREFNSGLWRAIESLPDDMRAMMYLHNAEGMSYEDIASAQGVSTGTVKSRLSRARDRLRKLLPDI